MKSALLALTLTLASVPAVADQIIPVSVDVPSFSGVAANQAVEVPPGAVELVGWSGWWYPDRLSGPESCRPTCIAYGAMTWWHHGQPVGVVHRLETAYFEPDFRTIPPRMFPAGTGHAAIPGDRVWANFYCGGGGDSRCGAGAVFYFRVPGL
jgi:hypothetical protein